jgi:AraC-like DNA-binding protein
MYHAPQRRLVRFPVLHAAIFGMTSMETSPNGIGNNAPVMRFSTDMFAPHERASAWCEAYGQTIAKLEVDPQSDAPFEAEATLSTLPGLGVVATQTAKMNWRCLFHSDDLALVMVESGNWVCTQRSREITLQAGEAAVFSDEDAMVGTTAGRRTMIRIPAAAIRPLIGGARVTLGRPIPAGTASLRLLQPYLRTIRDGIVTTGVQRLAVSHVHDLLAMLVGTTRDGAEVAAGRGVRSARLAAIKQDIARNLVDGDVSIGGLALRHRVTPRYVQKLFEDEGATFTEYVRGARLALAHRMLTEPRHAHEKVSTIAFDCGFGDLSHFHRAFRQRYGATAADVRAAARH